MNKNANGTGKSLNCCSVTHETYQQQRRATIKKIIQIIIDDMGGERKGALTTTFTIGVLEDAIRELEQNALMRPVMSFLER